MTFTMHMRAVLTLLFSLVIWLIVLEIKHDKLGTGSRQTGLTKHLLAAYTVTKVR